MPLVVLLGPQRFRPTLRDTVTSLGLAGPAAVVTAGWQEREGENDELRAHLDREVVDLLLYQRYEDVLLRDRELAAALVERQEGLRQLQDLYRMRLAHALEAARELLGREGRGGFLQEHRRAAIQAVRALDRQHLLRIQRIHREFEERWRPARRVAVARHREQLQQALAGADFLAIAGGHVAVLLNRLRLFELETLLDGRPIVAWSAGAMAVSERVVLFHDSPPQGPGNPEVLDAGLGLCRQVLPLPHARRRLRLDDSVRVALLARRFAPSACVLLVEGARLAWNGQAWLAGTGTDRLARNGAVTELVRA